jgi:flagellar biosynthesis protein FliQ
MGSDQAIFYMSQLVWTAMIVAGPLLVTTLVVGLLISIFQVATQIQEMTLSYVPKLLAAAIVLVVLGSWMLGRILQFAQNLYQTIPNLSGQ